MYEVIFLKEFYSNPSISIQAGYVNQSENKNAVSNTVSLDEGQQVMLFFQVKTPNMLFTLRTYGQHYMHVRNNLFCVMISPVGPIRIYQDKISDLAAQKIRQWVRHELNLLGITE